METPKILICDITHIIKYFIDKKGGVNKGCKYISKRLNYEWQWRHIANVYRGARPSDKLIKRLQLLMKPARKRHRKIIEATSKEQLEKWNTLSANELRDALDNQVDRISS